MKGGSACEEAALMNPGVMQSKPPLNIEEIYNLISRKSYSDS